MAKGKIKKWFGEKGYGFIIDDADGADVFFGRRALSGTPVDAIDVGVAVAFDREVNDKGPFAKNVRLLSGGREKGHSPGRARQASTSTESGALGRPYVPRSLQRLLQAVPIEKRHPGLHLDKFIPFGGKTDDEYEPCADQEHQKAALEQAIRAKGPPELPRRICEQRDAIVRSRGSEPWQRTTCAPLTLHLARSATLENAGICLHPLYGFVYLPGSGLKGMARSFAETVWLPSQPEGEQASGWLDIEAVFGWGPNSDSIGGGVTKPWKPSGTDSDTAGDSAAAGQIIFHDALPQGWPRLVVDIVNNHHTDYYQGKDDPGDWEPPVPVYFLAVPPGQAFSFAISKCRLDTPDRMLELAHLWLNGALTQSGCGGKTAAGYGYFASEQPGVQVPVTRKSFAVGIELVTPAFLSGARQYGSDAQHDCDLRAATLRGLLRWWWRTLHAGYCSRIELSALEACLWGDTAAGAAIQLRVEPDQAVGPLLFNHKQKYDVAPNFKRQHGLADRPDNKTTQGLFYASYGMDEWSGRQQESRRRYYLDAGSSWRVCLTARDGLFFKLRDDAKSPKKRGKGKKIDADKVLQQARAALYLLCNYGAVGSKCRKGFGSLSICQSEVPALSPDACRKTAAELRSYLSLGEVFQTGVAESSALGDPNLREDEVVLPWTDPWKVMDEIGFAYQSFAQRFKHDVDQAGVLTPTWTMVSPHGYTKASLGLPRKIHGPPMKRNRPPSWQPPVDLDFPRRGPGTKQRDARHASPIHIHVEKQANGSHVVRVLTFPAKYLPDHSSSGRLLQEFVSHFTAELKGRLHGAGATSTSHSGTRPSAVPGKRPSGSPATVKILDRRKKTKKGKEVDAGYLVQETGKPEGVLNLGPVPDPLPEIGAEVNVFVHNDDPKTPQYRWDDPRRKDSSASGMRGKPKKR